MPLIKCLCLVGVLAAQSASNAATPRSAFVDVAGVFGTFQRTSNANCAQWRKPS